jgi:hypothetical protein
MHARAANHGLQRRQTTQASVDGGEEVRLEMPQVRDCGCTDMAMLLHRGAPQNCQDLLQMWPLHGAQIFNKAAAVPALVRRETQSAS